MTNALPEYKDTPLDQDTKHEWRRIPGIEKQLTPKALEVLASFAEQVHAAAHDTPRPTPRAFRTVGVLAREVRLSDSMPAEESYVGIFTAAINWLIEQGVFVAPVVSPPCTASYTDDAGAQRVVFCFAAGLGDGVPSDIDERNEFCRLRGSPENKSLLVSKVFETTPSDRLNWATLPQHVALGARS